MRRSRGREVRQTPVSNAARPEAYGAVDVLGAAAGDVGEQPPVARAVSANVSPEVAARRRSRR